MHTKYNKADNQRFGYGLRRIADRLFYARIMAKLSREEVAKLRNVSVKTVRRWETRTGAPKNHQLILNLAEMYNISYTWLAFRQGNEKDNFATGLKFQQLEATWGKLNTEQQIKALIYIQKLTTK